MGRIKETEVSMLLLKIKNDEGRSCALEKLFKALNGILTFYANQYLYDKSLVGDVINDTILQVVRYISSYNPEYNGTNWIIKILRNNAFKHNKEWGKYLNIEDFDVLDGYQSEKTITETITIKNVVVELNAEEQCLFELYFVSGYSLREIAKISGISKSTLARKANDLKEKLYKKLK